MPNSIPVFAFAFAAFAATSTKVQNEPRRQGPTDADADELFMANWRASTQLDVRFSVKIAVDVASDPTYRLRERASARPNVADEIWLTEIVETPRGFSGVVSGSNEGGRPHLRGRQLGFQFRHILGWELSVNTGAPSGAEVLADQDIS